MQAIHITQDISMRKVLVVEDETDIANLVSLHVSDLGHQVEKVFRGDEALERAVGGEYDLIILDVMLPGLDGLEVCRKLRAKAVYTPIIMLTAMSEDVDKILGLETGADDYLTKPFSVRELLARVKAQFRRNDFLTQSPKERTYYTFDELEINLEKRRVLLAGKELSLTPKEFDLLTFLCAQPGRSFSRSVLLQQVWGYDFAGYEHTVNSHINRLRNKLEPDPNQPKYILTTWGVGYKFSDEV